jgi:lipid-binding SYLF domain-containing protein
MTRLILLGSLIAAVASAAAPKELTPDKRLQHAVKALTEIVATNDGGIPVQLIGKAQCIVIVPGLFKGAFLFGGKYGRGFVSCRKPRGGWTPPASVRIEGGSFGSQLGASSTDLIMLVMNKKGINHMLADKFTLGADIASVQGMTGKEASINTDATGRAEIITYSHAKGLFAGISLEGATIHADHSENKKIYGKDLNNKQILLAKVTTPPAAKPLVGALNKLARRA